MAETAVLDGELGNVVGAFENEGGVTRIFVVGSQENLEAASFDRSVEGFSGRSGERRRGDTEEEVDGMVGDETEEAHGSVGVVEGGEGDDSIDAVLETTDLVEAELGDTIIGAEESAGDLDAVGDEGGEGEKGVVRGRSRRVGREEEGTFAGVAEHANRIAELIVS